LALLPFPVQALVGADTFFLPPGELPDAAQLRAFGHGRTVALSDAAVGGRRRLRRNARLLGLEVVAEYAVLPSWGRATFVVEDEERTVRWLFSTIATVPPGVARGAGLLDLALRLATATGAVRLVGHLVPGRLLLARLP